MTTSECEVSAASAQRYARLAAALLVITVLAGGFGEMYVPSKLIVGSDATATAANLRASQPLFRAGFAAYLVEAICDITLAWIFFILLRPVHRDVAFLTVLLGIVSTATFAAAEMIYLASTLVLRDASYLSSFTGAQQSTIALLAVKTYGLGAGVFMVFYGIAMMLRGALMFRSGYLPKTIGVLLAIAGLGFTSRAFILVLAPRFASSFLLVPMLVATVSMIFWFSVKGVDETKWDAVA
jgi:hypothetical protein